MRKLSLFFILAIAQSVAFTQNFTILHNFGSKHDGQDPKGSLLLSDGVLYGLTSVGGDNNQGTLFSIQTDANNYQILHSFKKSTGEQPHHGPMILLTPTLYGAAYLGGNNNDGVIFSINSDGSNFNVVHDFSGSKKDGNSPHSGVISIGDFLYGMTEQGGANNAGTIYCVRPDGKKFNLLHSFTPESGQEPHGELTPDADASTLYGMTKSGGASNFGVIFALSGFQESPTYSMLHAFVGAPNDGATTDHGSLVRIGTTLYGMTTLGGTNNQGVIFSIEESGANYQILHSFGSGEDGQNPYGSLALSPNNILYGMTRNGGANGYGTIFQINPDGSAYTTLMSFDGANTGAWPIDNVTLSDDGLTLYGMTQSGGIYDPKLDNEYGTIFSLTLDAPSR